MSAVGSGQEGRKTQQIICKYPYSHKYHVITRNHRQKNDYKIRKKKKKKENSFKNFR